MRNGKRDLARITKSMARFNAVRRSQTSNLPRRGYGLLGRRITHKAAAAAAVAAVKKATKAEKKAIKAVRVANAAAAVAADDNTAAAAVSAAHAAATAAAAAVEEAATAAAVANSRRPVALSSARVPRPILKKEIEMNLNEYTRRKRIGELPRYYRVKGRNNLSQKKGSRHLATVAENENEPNSS